MRAQVRRNVLASKLFKKHNNLLNVSHVGIGFMLCLHAQSHSTPAYQDTVTIRQNTMIHYIHEFEVNAQQVTGIRGPKVAFFLLPIRSKKCLEIYIRKFLDIFPNRILINHRHSS